MVFVRTLPSHVLPPMKYSLPDSLPCEEAGLSTKDLPPCILGWWNYFGVIQSRNRLARLDVWIHRRLRALVWKQWKRARTRITELMARGIPKAFAVPVGASRKGPWRMSQVKWVVFAVPGRYFESLGLIIPWTSRA